MPRRTMLRTRRSRSGYTATRRRTRVSRSPRTVRLVISGGNVRVASRRRSF